MQVKPPLLSVELDTVLTVAEAGSLGAAARRLRLRQSTISRRVARLEDALGPSLFERRMQGVSLTEAGRRFLDRVLQAQDILDQAAAEALDAASAKVGALRLGYVWSFAAGVAADILKRFREQHPNIRCQFTELGAAELATRVLDRRLDCAWIVRWHDLDPALEIEPLWSEHLYFAVPDTLPLADPAPWTILADHPYLCRTSDEWRHFERHLDRVSGPRMDVQAHDCSRESLLALVAAGDGVTLLPQSIAEAGFPGVRFAPVADASAKLEICAIWRRETDNPALRRLSAIARDHRRRRPT